MSKKNESPFAAEALTTELQNSRKYRPLQLPDETIQDLIANAELLTHDPREIERIVREKLHHLVAGYLGDPDYGKLQTALKQAANDPEQLKNICHEVLITHASTRERLPILEEFYPRLFAFTGKPHVLLDLACALNPFALPWMNLLPETQYYAYDLHQPRLDAINTLFEVNHLPRLAIHQDILVEPPTIEADVALFFKEAHRFESRQHGCNRKFWQQIHARYLLVSLPTQNLTGSHPKIEQHRRLVEETVAGLNWKVTEIPFSNEIVFCIEKNA
jgi:16S rRNA (guanine(1405)-N(7))-methyltransferase